MKQILSCNIVRDLLPQYAENLCSEETRAAVSEHLERCEDCRALYRQMTGIPEPEPEQTAEVDYLKKVRRSRKRILVGALCLALLVGAGLYLYFRQLAAKPVAEISGETLIVNGVGGYDKLTLPELTKKNVNLDMQDDRFHLSAYLPMFEIYLKAHPDQTLADFLPGYLDRTDRSIAFLSDYLKNVAPDGAQTENAGKYVELVLRKRGEYTYENQKDRITLQIGDYYWHRDDMYVLALLDLERTEWQQIGYASYLAYCVNPYGDMNNGDVSEQEPFYDAYRKLGGTGDGTPEDNLRLIHAAAYLCLRNGTSRWGSTFSSAPVTQYGFYNGPKKSIAGNQLSAAQATSLIAWLTEQYGDEAVYAYCADLKSFTDAFGIGYPEAYEAWSGWLCQLCEG